MAKFRLFVFIYLFIYLFIFCRTLIDISNFWYHDIIIIIIIIINIMVIIVIIIVITIIKDIIGIASFFSSLLSVEYKSSSSNKRWQRNADHDESSYLSVLLNLLCLSVRKALNTLKLFNRRSCGLHSRRGFDTLRGEDNWHKMMKERDYHKKTKTKNILLNTAPTTTGYFINLPEIR